MDNGIKTGGFRIALRVGPSRCKDDVQRQHIQFFESKSLLINDRVFDFDYVFNQDHTQQQLYDTIMRPLVANVLRGYNCTALAYGQTGTGKSYSMGLNSEDLCEVHVGIVPRCLREIFQNIEKFNDEVDENQIAHSNTNSVFISFIEIYNEKVYDLLSNDSDIPIPSHSFKFTGGTRKQIWNVENFYVLFELGTKCRHVRPTTMNSASSRSHAIFTIHLYSNKFESRLNIVDLAGSECVRQTGHQGLAMSEGVNINQDLLCLNKVLYALKFGRKLIPYRDSVLTFVLQDSLNAKSYFTFLACISPDIADQTQTLSTLRFAQNARQLNHSPEFVILSERNPNTVTEKTSNQSLFKRPFDCSTVNQTNRTISSSNKPNMLHVNEALNRSQSEIGSAPNAQNNAMGRHMTSTTQLLERPDLHEQSTTESVLDFNEAPGSLADFNVLTSTMVDAPAVGQTNSTMQMTDLKDYLVQFENRMNNNMQEFFNTLLVTVPQLTGSVMSTETAAAASLGYDEVIEIPASPPVIDHIDLTEENINMPHMDMPTSSRDRYPMFPIITSVITIPSSLPRAQTSNQCEQQNNAVPATTSCEFTNGYWLRSRPTVTNNNLNQSGVSDLTDNRGQRLRREASTPRRSIRIQAQRDRSDRRRNYGANIRLKNHKKHILQLFNEGSSLQLQQLPTVGVKTACQVVMHRTLFGNFKSLSEIEKLPVWRCNAWARFAETNFLDHGCALH